MFALTIGVGPLRPLAAQLEACGVDAKAFFSGRGIDVALLQQRDARVPIPRLIGVWEHAAEAANDPAFGLHAARHVEVGELGVVSDLCAASSTLGAAIAQLSRYLRIVTETVTVKLSVDRSLATVAATFRMPPFAQGRHAVEFTLAALFHTMNALVRHPVQLRGVSFRHRAPRDAADAHRKLFAAPVRFGATVNALELDAGVLASEVQGASPARAKALDALAHRVLMGQPPSGPVTEQAARVVMGELRLGREVGLDAAARELGTSARSLQRSLRDEGTTFLGVVDGLRHGLALHHLSDDALSVGDVAFMLGFSEPAPFYRAFKRWTGETPLAHRARTLRR